VVDKNGANEEKDEKAMRIDVIKGMIEM